MAAIQAPVCGKGDERGREMERNKGEGTEQVERCGRESRRGDRIRDGDRDREMARETDRQTNNNTDKTNR